MKLLIRVLTWSSALSMVAAAGGAQAQGMAEAAYCITYIEVAPPAKDKAAALVKEFGAASRKSAGSLRFDVLRRIDRPNQFAIVEVWKDKAAYDANTAGAHKKQFQDKLAPMLITAYDERPHIGLAPGPVGAGAGARGGAVYVVTHIDVIPPKKDDAIAALKELAEPSRKDAGNLRFDALTQISRPNHSTAVEIWKDMAALEMHEAAAHTVKFRETLTPWSGALYDERLYHSLD